MNCFIPGSVALSVLCLFNSPVHAGGNIWTGGEKGAYYKNFCPPLRDALTRARFTGYQCQTSAGTGENINKVLAQPADVGLVQLDVYARWASENADKAKKLVVIRKDVACEGLWMVTRDVSANKDISDYGTVLGYARRQQFIMPPEASGSYLSFQFLQNQDPEGLGRAQKKNIKFVQDATAMLNEVAAGDGLSIGFFVQFADPSNGNIKLIVDKKLKVIPVVSREILRTQVDNQSLYEVQTFGLKEGLFAGLEATTACTPVAVITGNPEGYADKADVADQQSFVKRLSEVRREDLLPSDSLMASILKGAKKVGGRALDEMVAAADLSRKKIEELSR